MGLSASSSFLGLGLVLWLAGERVLAASPFRTAVGAMSCACLLLALGLDLAGVRKVDAQERTMLLRACSLLSLPTSELDRQLAAAGQRMRAQGLQAEA